MLETQDEFDLQDFFRAISRRWRLIAVITLVCTLVALKLVLFAAPVFTSSGSLYLGDGGDTMSSQPQTDFLSDYQVVSSVNTQIQLIQSPALLEQAILETGLNAQITPLGYTPLSYWKWRLFYGKAIDAFAPAPGALVAQFATFGDPSSAGASFRIVFGTGGNFKMVQPGGWFSAPVDIGTGQLGQPASVDDVAFILRAVPGVPPPEAGNVYNVDIIPAKAMADDIANSVAVQATGPAVAPTNVAQVQFAWNNPYQATDFVQRLMQDFIQNQLSWKTQSASNTETYISQQLDKISHALAQANQNQAAYQSQTGIVDVNSNSQAVINQLSNYQSQRSTLLLQQEALQQLVQSVTEHQTGGINPYLITQANDPVLSALATTLANAQIKLQSDETQFTGLSPEVRQEEATIARIETAIGTLLTNDEEAATKNLANIDSMIAQYQSTLKSMPAESLQVGQLSRSSDVLGSLYGLLMQKEEEAAVSKAATIEDTRIVSPAEVPLAATSPRPTIAVAAGVLLGLIAGFGTVLIQRALAGNFRTEMEVRSAVPISFYGNVPRRAKADLKFGVFSPSPGTPFSESFRTFRRKLAELPSAQKSRVVLVASAAELDGKTTIAANIAKAFGDVGRRVLLIDADLRCGNVHETLGLPAGPGLAEVLQGGNKAQIVGDNALSFRLLRSGDLNADTVDLLNVTRLGELFAVLREEYDFIIMDSPPLPLVSDALVLAKFADIVLSVARVEHTPRRAFATHCEMLDSSSYHHAIVINNVDVGGGGYAAGYGAGGRPRQSSAGMGRRLVEACTGLFRRSWQRLRIGG